MQFSDFSKLDLSRVSTPCFVVDEAALQRNLAILHDVAERSGAKILGALKAFSMWHFAPLTAKYLAGTCASGLHEARLGYEKYGGEVHVYAAGYTEADLQEMLTFANHVVFNSCSQWQRFQPLIRAASETRPELKFGLRINPEHSEGDVDIYNPCASGSRLGVVRSQLDEAQLDGISGLHFHTLCEQMYEPLDRTLDAVEARFGDLLHSLEWVNFGGGHHITVPGYDIEALISRVIAFSEKYGVQVYLEPGEAVAVGTGVLVAEVLDIGFNTLPQAILNASATCHMPDILEMPYRADILGAGQAGEKAHTYRLGGLTCLAGDVMGDYSFDTPLVVGQKLIFEDMAHYTMVKTSTFNGARLPDIVVWNSVTDALNVIKRFNYDDFLSRLS
ncbi:Carboxynorspermidine/carboxyspermidine decarboxylase [BD1-7 clade bacterium]|uniref:Carboxynorspermidine/carboxyspermidine decarboxylase n=1 Tax=BD1-7 clade bacterium TaxID=2029982 RepID=A0A5S9QG80_9GAMM|nr:Carboxynorspermidine/carboxyspermidine decarboxylase [BD1-7 clade bacterium]CAA0116996.1 Carboxynorspermidine/carboxyspermidine decarboxylase [BD1-7 clade bacterium]